MSKSKRKTQAPRPRRALAPEQFSELNGTFYDSDPASYFRTRIQSLMLLLSGSGRVDEELASGLSYGGLKFGPTERPQTDQRKFYAALESSVLLHHAAETLFRLFLAHREEPPCPWLEISGAKQPDVFKKEVEDFVNRKSTEEDRASISRVFLGGTSSLEAEIGLDDAAWGASVDGLVALLKAVGGALLDESGLYNAAKHGLAGSPQDSGAIDLNGFRIGGGTSVMYLQRKKTERAGSQHDVDTWYATMHFSRVDSDLTLTEYCARAISSLWAVARRNYCGLAGHVICLSAQEVAAARVLDGAGEWRPAHSVDHKLATVTTQPGGQTTFDGTDVLVHMLNPDLVREGLTSEAMQGPQSSAESASQGGGVVVDLPIRTRDERPHMPSGRYLTAYGPSWSADPRIAES